MLQGYVSHLRKTLEPGRARGEHELLVSRAPGYVLQIRAEQLDAVRFERLLGEARHLMTTGDAEAAAEHLRAALELWRGPALADLAYEPFARVDIDRLEELRLAALEDRIDADLALGRHGAVVGELRELVERHPLRERLRAQLMAALYRCGRQAAALEVYREGRRILLDELGIEPGPALRELERGILHQDPALGVPASPPLPIAQRMRRRWSLLVAAAVLVGITLAGVLAFSGGAKAVVVRPDSVAVIDPADNALVDDIAVGGYPGPLAADGKSVYVCNIGDATVSSIDPAAKKVSSTFSLSRAIDLVAVNEHLWAADGGVAGHTPYPPGTVVDLEFYSFETRSIRVGPSFEGYGGNEASTTIAADADGAQVWAGNKESETLTQLEPMTMAKLHGVRPGGVAVVGSAGTGDTVWASDQTRDLVVRIDGSSRRITHRIAVPGQPARIVADNRAVWVTTRGTADLAHWPPTRATHPAVWRIDAKSNEAVDRIALPLSPVRIALGAGAVWVTAERVLSSDGSTVDATVFRIDPATSRIVARIPLHTRAVDGIIVSHGLIWVAVPPSQ